MSRARLHRHRGTAGREPRAPRPRRQDRWHRNARPEGMQPPEREQRRSPPRRLSASATGAAPASASPWMTSTAAASAAPTAATDAKTGRCAVAEEPEGRARVLDDRHVVPREVGPPEREHDEEAPGDEGRIAQGPSPRWAPRHTAHCGHLTPSRPRRGHRSLDGLDRGQDDLPEHDDREQAVALGDVVGVERRVPVPRSAMHGTRSSSATSTTNGARNQDAGTHSRAIHRSCTTVMPPAYVSAVSRRSRVVRGGAQPQGDHAEPHDRRSRRRRGPTGRRRRGRARRGEEQAAGHDDEGQQPEDDVVVVVGRGEPGVAHPRPPDGEPRERVAEDGVEVARREAVVQLRRVARDGDDEDEVEEQLERGRGAVRPRRRRARPRSAQRHGHDAHEPRCTCVAYPAGGGAGHSAVSTASPLRFVTGG